MRRSNKHQMKSSEPQSAQASPKWHHPGGKLIELGPENLSDAELLAILISTGIKEKTAEKIAEEILAKFGSFRGMANQPLSKFLQIKGLGDVKIIRIAAAFEIAQRILNMVLENHLEDYEEWKNERLKNKV